MSLQFAVVYEARADFQIATELADRVLVESVDWLDDEILESQRFWEHQAGETALAWRSIRTAATNLGIRASGHFDGQPGKADALAARRAIRVLRHKFPDLAGVILIRDQDDQPNRRAGLEQA